ncbi:hypothetical protein H632_c4624p0 [Helicosporidium sp. ATCC 50920]|nr:hypothetical protein H632_c4624p0 [Helicosporidium sp. ATCC 50920]|eukprot:KDD71652.1 hypothetical protein H632_c4624p0 [Helicosporidium sp. ATCC 50920]
MSGSDVGSAPASDCASARPFLRRKSERVRSQALDWSSVRARTSSTRRGEGEASASPSPTARQFAEFAELAKGGGRRASAPSGNGTPLGRDGSGNGTPFGRDSSKAGTPLRRDSSKAGTPFGRDSSKASTPMTSGAGTPFATPSGAQGQARGEGPAWRRPRTPGEAGPLDGLLGQVDALLLDVQRALR